MNDEPEHEPQRREPPGVTPPLPREWLPPSLSPEGSPEWETRAARIMTAAGPGLARLQAGVGVASGSGLTRASRRTAIDANSWWSEVGRWWKASAALAVASLALLLAVVDRPHTGAPEVTGDALALGFVMAGGDPAGFWHALGIPADPVLALLALEDHRPLIAPARPDGPPEGGAP